MAKPYRWGDVPPQSVERVKARRVYRASALFAGIKQARGEQFDAERAAQTPTSVAARIPAGSPTSAITWATEGESVVVRIPSSLTTKVVIALESIQGEYPVGWAVQEGVVTAASPLVERCSREASRASGVPS